MNVIVGTKNKSKIAIVSQIFAEYFSGIELRVNGVDIASSVPDTPRDEETKIGAYNRAQGASQSAIYGIGIESGLVQRYGMWFEEAWACIVTGGRAYYGYSSGLAIPEYVLHKMSKDSLEHGPTMQRILKDLDWPDIRDTWGTYSAKQLSRDVSLQEALRNALIQTLDFKDSLYQHSD